MYAFDDADDLITHIIDTHDNLEQEAERARYRARMGLTLSQVLRMREMVSERRARMSRTKPPTSKPPASAPVERRGAPSRPPRGPRVIARHPKQRRTTRIEITIRIV